MTRIGLTQRVVEVPDYGERRDCLDQAWTTLLEGMGFDPVPLPNRIDAVEGYLDRLSLDGVILTSGNDLTTVDNPSVPAPERDEFETEVLEYAIERTIPVLGVCRGLELLNEYFGGTLSPVEGHVATEHPLTFEDSDLEDIHTIDATVNSYHDYGITSPGLADVLHSLAVAPDDTVEFARHDDYPLWGIMWHPERDLPRSSLDRTLLDHVFGGATA